MKRIKSYLKILTMTALIICYSPGFTETIKTNPEDEGSRIVVSVGGIEMAVIDYDPVQPFMISRYEVTQKIYESVMGKNPSYFKGENLPVEQVSWYNAVDFCNKLSLRTGLKPYYEIDRTRNDPENNNSGFRWTVTVNPGANGFRLPTSSEWEIAARGGSVDKYFWGNEMIGDYCWYSENSGNTTHPVGLKKPNSIGLFDVCGNVSEWCFDRYPMYTSFYRIVRDGHYNLDAEEMTLDKVDYRSPHFEFGFTGIRLVKNL